MMVWLAGALLLVALVAGIVYAVVRGIQLWRNVKRSNAAFSTELDRINAASAQIDHHLAAAEAAGARLKNATERLGRSRAQLTVQLAAVQEARARLRRTFWFVPGV
jgi:uncharacterized protein HemX